MKVKVAGHNPTRIFYVTSAITNTNHTLEHLDKEEISICSDLCANAEIELSMYLCSLDIYVHTETHQAIHKRPVHIS